MKTIVLVDDEPIARLDLSFMLADMGFSVVGEASDGYDAVEVCRQQKPDIVLMDIKMPIFDGFGAAEIILQNDMAKCLVMITAFYDAELIERANQIGATGYLVKPIDRRMLLPTIEVAYSQSRRLSETRKEAADARRKLEETRLIDRAKSLVAYERGITEGEAYRELQRLAMNKRCSLLSLALSVVQRNSQRETVNRAKEYLMRLEGISEQDAYKRLTMLARAQKGTLQQAAQRVLGAQREGPR